jgi:hypothetical protein
MTKKIAKITTLCLFAAALVAMPVLSSAQDNNAPASPNQTAPAKPKKHSNPPFHGKLSAVDMSAKTLTAGTLTLQITPDTRITKDGRQPATLSDGKVGQPISGSYKKTDDGKLNVVTVRFGARNGEKPKKGSSNN